MVSSVPSELCCHSLFRPTSQPISIPLTRRVVHVEQHAVVVLEDCTGARLLRLKKTLCSQTHKQTAQTEIHSELYLVWVWSASWAHLGQPVMWLINWWLQTLQETPSKHVWNIRVTFQCLCGSESLFRASVVPPTRRRSCFHLFMSKPLKTNTFKNVPV